jgi:hypothetical protein
VYSILWFPFVFTPGKSILALPLNDTPPIVLAFVNVATLPEVKAKVPEELGKFTVMSEPKLSVD